MNIIELYEFTLDNESWHYTSGNEQITYNTNLYIPQTIGRNNTQLKNELSKASLRVSMDISNTLSNKLISSYIDNKLNLTLYIQDQISLNTHVGWKGRLSNLKFEKDNLVLSFESIFTSLRRPGLRARYQKTCRHALYSSGCGLTASNFSVSGTVSSVNGNIVTIAEAALQSDGYYLGGMMQAPDGTFLFIVNHVGSDLTVQHQNESFASDISSSGYGYNYGNLYGDAVVNIFPGCNKTRQVCLDRFNNLDQFGGFPWIPNINPMGGSSII